MREYIIISKSVQNVTMYHHVNFHVCILTPGGAEGGRIGPPRLYLISQYTYIYICMRNCLGEEISNRKEGFRKNCFTSLEKKMDGYVSYDQEWI